MDDPDAVKGIAASTVLRIDLCPVGAGVYRAGLAVVRGLYRDWAGPASSNCGALQRHHAARLFQPGLRPHFGYRHAWPAGDEADPLSLVSGAQGHVDGYT